MRSQRRGCFLYPWLHCCSLLQLLRCFLCSLLQLLMPLLLPHFCHHCSPHCHLGPELGWVTGVEHSRRDARCPEELPGEMCSQILRPKRRSQEFKSISTDRYHLAKLKGRPKQPEHQLVSKTLRAHQVPKETSIIPRHSSYNAQSRDIPMTQQEISNLTLERLVGVQLFTDFEKLY
jgi:hypothetical protein